MFRSSLREFDEDPFFSDPFRAHRDHMRQMMRSFSEPFGGPLMPSITDGRSRGRDMAEHPSSSVALRNEHREQPTPEGTETNTGLIDRGLQAAPSSLLGASKKFKAIWGAVWNRVKGLVTNDMSRSLLPFGGTDSSDMMRNPFGMFDSMMASVRNRMEEMHSNFENMSTDSNAHSFSSSSVMTYSKVGNEPPKVFQATSSTRRAPGGIIETQQAVKDSESGLEKMKIGHHIQDRGHVVEKKINKKTGEREFNQDFQNLDESEAQSFDDEWQQKVSTFQPSVPMSRLNEPQPRAVRQAALTGPEQQPRRDQQRSKSAGRVRIEGSAKK